MILADITVTSGSPNVTLNSSEDISSYREGDLLFVAGQNPLTILSISVPSITLKENSPFSAANTAAEIIASNVYLRGALDVIQKNNDTWGIHFSPFLNWISTSDLQANLIDNNGAQVTVYSAQGLNQLAADVVAADLQLDTLEPRVDQMETDLAAIESTLDAKVQATDANVVLTNADVVSASNSASAAAASATAAAASFDNFDDKYLGPHASDPATDNDGDPLIAGQTYWNTTVSGLRYYNGAAWDQPDAAAQASADAASTSETNAAASALLSERFANYPEDQVVPGTSLFSAFHYMKKTEELSGGTAPDSFKLGGQDPSFYATKSEVDQAILNSLGVR